MCLGQLTRTCKSMQIKQVFWHLGEQSKSTRRVWNFLSRQGLTFSIDFRLKTSPYVHIQALFPMFGKLRHWANSVDIYCDRDYCFFLLIEYSSERC